MEKDFFREFGERPLQDITATDIQTVVYRRKKGAHSTAAIHIRNAIKRMYGYAIELCLVAINPAAMAAANYGMRQAAWAAAQHPRPGAGY